MDVKTVLEREKKNENNAKPIEKKKKGILIVENHIKTTLSTLQSPNTWGERQISSLWAHSHWCISLFIHVLVHIFPSYPLVRIFILLIHPGRSLGALVSHWAPSSCDLQRAADSHSSPSRAFSVGVTSVLQRLCRTSVWRLWLLPLLRSETRVRSEALLPNKIWTKPELSVTAARPIIKLSIKS